MLNPISNLHHKRIAFRIKKAIVVFVCKVEITVQFHASVLLSLNIAQLYTPFFGLSRRIFDLFVKMRIFSQESLTKTRENEKITRKSESQSRFFRRGVRLIRQKILTETDGVCYNGRIRNSEQNGKSKKNVR